MRRPCGVCGQPIPTTDLRRATCGHPRCQRTWQQTTKAARALARGESPPTAQQQRPARDRRDEADWTGRARILRLMDAATEAGVSEFMALVAVARATGEPVAVVRAVWTSRDVQA